MVNKLGAICAVYGCNNYRQQLGRESKSFFRMPKDLNLLKSWIVACKRQDLDCLLKSKDSNYFYNTYVICSDHFQLECFRNKNLFSQGLVPGSIPTLKLFKTKNPIKRKIKSRDEVKPKKMIRVEENEDALTSLPCKSSHIKSPEEENVRLNQLIKEYQKNLKLKSNLLWKYRKRIQLLREKLLKSEKAIVSNPVPNVIHLK